MSLLLTSCIVMPHVPLLPNQISITRRAAQLAVASLHHLVRSSAVKRQQKQQGAGPLAPEKNNTLPSSQSSKQGLPVGQHNAHGSTKSRELGSIIWKYATLAQPCLWLEHQLQVLLHLREQCECSTMFSRTIINVQQPNALCSAQCTPILLYEPL